MSARRYNKVKVLLQKLSHNDHGLLSLALATH